MTSLVAPHLFRGPFESPSSAQSNAQPLSTTEQSSALCLPRAHKMGDWVRALRSACLSAHRVGHTRACRRTLRLRGAARRTLLSVALSASPLSLCDRTDRLVRTTAEGCVPPAPRRHSCADALLPLPASGSLAHRERGFASSRPAPAPAAIPAASPAPQGACLRAHVPRRAEGASQGMEEGAALGSWGREPPRGDRPVCARLPVCSSSRLTPPTATAAAVRRERETVRRGAEGH